MAIPASRSSGAVKVPPANRPSDSELRRRWQAHFRAFADAVEAFEVEADARAAAGVRGEPKTNYPAFPDELRGLQCGARTRAGTPCKRSDLMTSGRCKLHGGLSTGAKTDEGRARSRSNLALRWRPSR